jgi:hypothetical protein
MKPEPERESDRYPLTVEQARDLTLGVMSDNLADQEVIGDFLLLARSLVYSDNQEDLMRAVEAALMPYTLCASNALDGLISSRLEAAEDREAPAAAEGDGKGRNSPAELAGHLSAVLTHPATPAPLYEAIANQITAWSSDYCNAVSETVPYIESCLLYHQREQHERTEGGSTDAEQS